MGTNNPDIVASIHVLRVEIIIEYVMRHVFPSSNKEPFLDWLRYEWGKNGHPHCNGLACVAGNPSFECVVKDDETREQLRATGYHDAA